MNNVVERNIRQSFYSTITDEEKTLYNTENGKNRVYPKSETERNEIMNAMAKSALLRSIPSHELEKIADSFFLFNVGKNQLIIRQGEKGFLFFIIREGLFEVSVDGVAARLYKNSGYFGELALMHGQPRSATVRCLTGGQLWAIDRLKFKRSISKAAQETRSKYIGYLKKVRLFRNLSEGDMCDLADSFKLHNFTEGEIIIEQGEPADSMYFVVDGDVTISICLGDNQGINSPASTMKTLKICREGEYFGEFGLLTSQKLRIASAIATSKKVTVASIDADTFDRVQKKCMETLIETADEYNKALQDVFMNYDVT
ncbi:hypothetical protein GJ496_000101 [Pomphorhynchus laevis]|nr:hypothetical protein GJ496_000101 [Pomphorhynchus laevis]